MGTDFRRHSHPVFSRTKSNFTFGFSEHEADQPHDEGSKAHEDKRVSITAFDKRVHRDDELSDSEDEGLHVVAIV